MRFTKTRVFLVTFAQCLWPFTATASAAKKGKKADATIPVAKTVAAKTTEKGKADPKAVAVEKQAAKAKATASAAEAEGPVSSKTARGKAKTLPAEEKPAPKTVAAKQPAPAPAPPPAPQPPLGVGPVSFVVSVPEQRLYVFNEGGEKVASYKVSTSSHGLGDGRGTYATPLGYLEVAAKIGANAPVGAVFKGGHRTGEVCAVNAPGRDPIVTRILHLRGLEKGNASAFARCIYIHGTPDERRIGKQVSYGCIRMRSADVVELFERATVGTRVEITQDRVTNMFGSVVRPPAPIGAGPSPVIAPAPGLIVKATSDAPQTARTEKRATVAVNPQIALSAREKGAAQAPTAPRAGGSKSDPSDTHLKLMETSVLSIQFGGGLDRDRRDR